jgi:hypothetical protein
MAEEFKTVARFSDPMSAEIAAGMLRSNGIPAEVFGQTSSYPSINAAFQNVELKVNAEDYESARNLLAANDKAE